MYTTILPSTNLYSFGIAWAAVFLTYGLMSAPESRIASITIGTMTVTLMLDKTLSALARINWFGSCKIQLRCNWLLFEQTKYIIAVLKLIALSCCVSYLIGVRFSNSINPGRAMPVYRCTQPFSANSSLKKIFTRSSGIFYSCSKYSGKVSDHIALSFVSHKLFSEKVSKILHSKLAVWTNKCGENSLCTVVHSYSYMHFTCFLVCIQAWSSRVTKYVGSVLPGLTWLIYLFLRFEVCRYLQYCAAIVQRTVKGKWHDNDMTAIFVLFSIPTPNHNHWVNAWCFDM
jgi:hypothetical protein